MQKQAVKKYVFYALLLGIILAALLLRISAIPSDGLWLDELYSLWVASGSFPGGILEKLYTEDAHAPLYHFILHFYVKFFGSSDLALQYFNVLISMCLFPIVYLLGYEAAGGKNGKNSRWFALLCILLLAFNYLHIAFSSWVRFYNLGAVFFTLSTLFLFKQINTETVSKKYFAVAALSNILLCYTLTQGCIYVFIQALVFGFYFLFNKRELIKPLVITSITTALFFLPYIPFALHQLSISQGGFFGANQYSHFVPIAFAQILPNFFELNPIVTTYLGNLGDFSTTYSKWLHVDFVLKTLLSFIFLIMCFSLKDAKKKLLFFLLLSLFLLHTALSLSMIAPVAHRVLIPLIPIFAICYASAISAFRLKAIKVLIICAVVIPGVVMLLTGTKIAAFVQPDRQAPLVEALNLYDLTPDDLLYVDGSIVAAKLLSPKGIKANYIDICFNSTLVFYNPERLNMFFGDDYLKYNTKEERRNYIDEYISDKNVSIHNKNYYDLQIAKLKNGKRFVYVQREKSGPRNYSNFVIDNKVENDYKELITGDKRLKLLSAAAINRGVPAVVFVYQKIKD